VLAQLQAAMGSEMLALYPARVADAVQAALRAVCSTSDAPADGAALDIGCGAGGVAFALADTFARVVAVDRDAGSLALARSLQDSAVAPLQCGPSLAHSPCPTSTRVYALVLHICIAHATAHAERTARAGAACAWLAAARCR
jgi:SAM-dependent methyltransferase